VKIAYKNSGQYVGYSLDGTMLSMRGGGLTVDLSELERDYDVRVDICEDGGGELVIGFAKRYVAQLHIPAREYVVSATPKSDDFGFPVLVKEAKPFDADNVSLTLWNTHFD
jgi:hypothetical protein